MTAKRPIRARQPQRWTVAIDVPSLSNQWLCYCRVPLTRDRNDLVLHTRVVSKKRHPTIRSPDRPSGSTCALSRPDPRATRPCS
jgi:hypothetical protein